MFSSLPSYSFLRAHWLTIAFGLGFVTDFLLLNRVDDTVDNLILLFYVLLATLSLVLFYVAVSERGPAWFRRFLAWGTPLSMQYAFGGLLSGMLIFYGRSGDLITSAPFLLLIVSVILMNELVEKRSDRLLYNLTVYFIGLFSYTVLMVPVWLGDMGNAIFIGSGLLALLVFYLVVQLLKLVIPNFLRLELRFLVFIVGTLYALMNAFYFFNLIPPIPLSLTELSIYQSVERTGAVYRITKEEQPWYRTLVLPGVLPVFRPLPGQGATCFARVYAPTDLRTDIVHRWEFKNAAGDWELLFTKSYAISGENKGGYRGFTTSLNIKDGVWRCSVENNRGQVLGREVFRVDTSEAPKHVVTVVE